MRPEFPNIRKHVHGASHEQLLLLLPPQVLVVLLFHARLLFLRCLMQIFFFLPLSAAASVYDTAQHVFLVDQAFLDLELLVVYRILHVGDLLGDVGRWGESELADEGLNKGRGTCRFSEKESSGLRMARSRWGKRDLSIWNMFS